MDEGRESLGADERSLVEAVERIGRLMRARSAAFADEFAEDAILIGSEPGEVARGREAIRELIAAFHALPARYSWEWERIDCRIAGAVGWLFAEGAVVKEDPDGAVHRRAYRLSGVLSRNEQRWTWSCFHGSEPKT